MTNRENALAVLRYEKYDRLPLVHFGYWPETVRKWIAEGHLSADSAENVWDDSPNETEVSDILGFDFGWSVSFAANTYMDPYFETEIVGTNPDGSRLVRNASGVTEIHKDGAGSIPAEVDHLLKDRDSWERHYKHRFLFSPDRIDFDRLERLRDGAERDKPVGLSFGSLMGNIRNTLGLQGLSYLYVDDEELYGEIIDTVAGLCFRLTEEILKTGVKFDFAHFWEDICFKNGPLVSPAVFEEYTGHHYKKMTGLAMKYGIDIVSLDCDGMIDALIPTWLENGVNTMFPIEVGTWNASIKPWREKYDRRILGVGGMNKTVFARDYRAVDEEIERLKPLVELGGFIPCPDHRIAPDAVWENVQYYCEKFRKVFG